MGGFWEEIAIAVVVGGLGFVAKKIYGYIRNSDEDFKRGEAHQIKIKPRKIVVSGMDCRVSILGGGSASDKKTNISGMDSNQVLYVSDSQPLDIRVSGMDSRVEVSKSLKHLVESKLTGMDCELVWVL